MQSSSPVWVSSSGLDLGAASLERLHWSALVGIAGPLFLLGILFLVNWIFRKQIGEAPTETA